MKKHALFMKRGSKKHGIDWMRYTEEVLKPILIPWIQNLNKNRPIGTPNFVFQQDNAKPHVCKWTLEVLAKAGIEILPHPGNSPNINAIKGI